jgi:subtilase family serine protease
MVGERGVEPPVSGPPAPRIRPLCYSPKVLQTAGKSNGNLSDVPHPSGKYYSLQLGIAIHHYHPSVFSGHGRHFPVTLSMQLPFSLMISALSVANSFLPLTSPTRTASIPNAKFHSYVHVSPGVSSTPGGLQPDQVRHAYGMDDLTLTGIGRTLAIVDAFAEPNLAADLGHFNDTFKLTPMYGTPGHAACSVAAGPHPCLEIDNLGTTKNADWSIEADLDTQWAHATATGADIVVVNAKDDSERGFANALEAVAAKHPDVTSMSWGGGEFTRETDWDGSIFSKGHFVAASGDDGTGSSFPAASPDVLSVGGTSLKLDAAGNRISDEVAWSGSGGGASEYEARPLYQKKSVLDLLALTPRLIPDVALNADPVDGYSVYNGEHWLKVGGTSASAPQWAAMLLLGKSIPSNNKLYHLGFGADNKSYFTDITNGSNGSCGTLCQARSGYDTVTGLGTPHVDKLSAAI